MPEPTSKLAAFLAELKRRRVFRVAIVYAGVTFVIIQIIDGAFPAMHIPDWVGSLVVTLLLLGFPAAVGLAWAFDITEKGVVRTPAKEGSPTPLIAARPAPQTPPAIGQDAPETAPAPSIAVLPFMDLSPEKDQDYFCDGMAEELIDALTKIKDLRVSARTSAFSFKGQQQDIREIGQKLNVATVLEGSVRKSDTRLRISAQLINVADGYHLWSEKYDRDLKDVFAIQDEIAGNIVQALRVMLSPKEKRALGKVPTTDVEAYDVYLRGRKFFHQLSRKNIAFARQMFNRATQIDPDYALAYAGIADCHSWLYMYWESTDANLRAAEEASRKALELDTDLAEAHVAHGLAVSLSEQYDEAEREFETAIRLDPRLFEAYYFYARTCWPQGKPEKAAELFEKACEVNPEDYQGPLFLANTYNGLGRKTKAETAYRRSLEIIERHLELNPDDARAHYLGANALIQLGEGKRGLKWARRALAIDPGDALILYNVACIYALSEEIEEAIDYLEKSARAGANHKEWIEHDSDLDPLRSHPHFQALLAQMS